MKYSQVDKRTTRQHMNLDNLDRALQDLGMLSAVTEARRDYLQETSSDYCMMRFNTRYVSNVTVGYCMRRTAVKNRLCPYLLPVRHRTKSENSDAIVSDITSERNHEPKVNINEPSTSGLIKVVSETLGPAKRCQSLENLSLSGETNVGLETSQDLDCVSTRIQKLQVDE